MLKKLSLSLLVLSTSLYSSEVTIGDYKDLNDTDKQVKILRALSVTTWNNIGETFDEIFPIIRNKQHAGGFIVRAFDRALVRANTDKSLQAVINDVNCHVTGVAALEKMIGGVEIGAPFETFFSDERLVEIARQGRERDLGIHKSTFETLAQHLLILYSQAPEIHLKLVTEDRQHDFTSKLTTVLVETTKAENGAGVLNKKLKTLKTEMRFYEDLHKSEQTGNHLPAMRLAQMLAARLHLDDEPGDCEQGQM